MYAGIDVGGTKTLVASIDEHGTITEKIRFETPKNYDDFVVELRATVAQLKTQEFRAGAVGMPASHINRDKGIGEDFGNLPWHCVHMQTDVEQILGCPVVIDNDAKLAGLSEAMLLKDKRRVLYITVSTGIGYALVVDGHIDENVGDAGGRALLAEHNGKFVPWESFASGHAIVERYGKKAEDITDEATWRAICRDLSKGLIELIAVMQPEVIVVGGSVGTYFERYHDILRTELTRYETPFTPIPELRQAERPEEAVLFGCYDLVKEQYAHAH